MPRKANELKPEVELEKYKGGRERGRPVIDLLRCSMCTRKDATVSLVSTTLIKEQYDRPTFHLVLCGPCLLRLTKTLLR